VYTGVVADASAVFASAMTLAGATVSHGIHTHGCSVSNGRVVVGVGVLL